ncbi:hypothetical protein [Cecembia lonarensis]|uniref:hypothetical protein n=1 Tax=Cecembia lonarensis TaxID=645110 RepID=UPI0002EA2B44|nr:hypothetical protein [Cecembia lonarensis]
MIILATDQDVGLEKEPSKKVKGKSDVFLSDLGRGRFMVFRVQGSGFSVQS